MVDWDGLENRCALTGTVGSNPTLSAMGPSTEAPLVHWDLVFHLENRCLADQLGHGRSRPFRRIEARLPGTRIALPSHGN